MLNSRSVTFPGTLKKIYLFLNAKDEREGAAVEEHKVNYKGHHRKAKSTDGEVYLRPQLIQVSGQFE